MMQSESDAETRLDHLSAGLADAAEDADRMARDLAEMDRHIGKLSRSIDRGLKQAIEGAAFEGRALSSVLKGLATSVVRSTFNVGISPVTRHLSGILAGQIESFIHGATPFARGGAFSQGRVVPFASGGIVSGPTAFPMRGGTGLMGEAGPEAIMPLARGADGRLGVRAAGGGRPVNVTINVATPDVEGFRKSRAQIAAQVSRVLSHGARNR